MELVLASGSPRRRVLLAELGVTFTVAPTDVDETPRPGEPADVLVHRLAEAKARAGMATAGAPAVVLAADTVVSVEGVVLGKPVDEADAARMLRTLSGTRHQVLTGVAVASQPPDSPEPLVAVEVVVTHVHMRPWTDGEIEDYVASGEPMDKAGSYAIQEGADRFVTRIEGRFDNVVGLPLDVTRTMLLAAGMDVPRAAPAS